MKKICNEKFIDAKKPSEAALALLDSSLISQTNKKKYNIKIINCNNFMQAYIYPNLKTVIDRGLESPVIKVITKTKKNNKKVGFKKARKDNLFRSKNNCERLAKSNMNHFKSFITLTFKENVVEIKKANKEFNIWRTRIKSIFPDFKYICVPEFQKRGAVHYHLLTNIILNGDIIYLQNNETYKYDVLFWNEGFSSAKPIDDVNVVPYISKYITKDYDNRYYGHRKYLYSQNLEKPKIEYLNTNNNRDIKYINNLIVEYNANYSSEYYNKYSKETINFIEYSNINTILKF